MRSARTPAPRGGTGGPGPRRGLFRGRAQQQVTLPDRFGPAHAQMPICHCWRRCARFGSSGPFPSQREQVLPLDASRPAGATRLPTPDHRRPRNARDHGSPRPSEDNLSVVSWGPGIITGRVEGRSSGTSRRQQWERERREKPESSRKRGASARHLVVTDAVEAISHPPRGSKSRRRCASDPGAALKPAPAPGRGSGTGRLTPRPENAVEKPLGKPLRCPRSRDVKPQGRTPRPRDVPDSEQTTCSDSDTVTFGAADCGLPIRSPPVRSRPRRRREVWAGGESP